MTRKITIYLEDADGQFDRCTGIHVERRNGTAVWLTGAALDTNPAGSPRTWRQIGERARDDALGAPTYVIPTPPAAPSPHDIRRAQDEVAAAHKRIADAAALTAEIAKKKAEADAVEAQAQAEIAAAEERKAAAEAAQARAIAAIQAARDAELAKVTATEAELAAADAAIAAAKAGEVVG